MSSDPFHIRREEVRDDDPSVLAAYLHSSRREPTKQHITSTEIKALRSTTSKKKNMFSCLLGGLIQGWQALISGIGGLFSCRTKVNSSCSGGHIAPKSWGDGYPHCLDCGVEIRSPEDLRGSSKFR
jgi:hypothetical protein